MTDQLQEPEKEAVEEEEVIGLDPELVTRVAEALHDENLETVEDAVQALHPGDMADLLESVTPDERTLLVKIAAPMLEPEVLSYLDSSLRSEVCEQLGPKQVARALRQLDSDDAVELFEDLSEEQRQAMLTSVPAQIRKLLQEGLEFPEDSAGRMMQREVVVIPAIWTVGETIDYMRNNRKKLPPDFYDLFVVDPRYKPIGKVPLSRVMRNKRPTAITKLMDEVVYPVPVTMDQEEVAYLFRQYSLVSAPVTDSADRLVGMITIDDIVHVIDEEAEEDILRLGGVTESSLYGDVLETTRSRFIWLLVNLGTAVLASFVIGLFGATIEQQVALAILMPIVASMGGNAGTQTLTVAVRALAMKDLVAGAGRRFIGKELIVGFLNGLLFAVVTGGVTFGWFGDPILALVISLAMIINMIVAGLFGTLIPIGLDRAGIDPAIASSVFLTTVTDIIGFFSFLGLAALILL